jgi:hypothetical protein
MMNTISERQNDAQFQKLLRARQQIYIVAQRYQIARLLLTVAVPFLTGLFGIFFQQFRPYAAAGSVFLTILDVALLERAERAKIRMAALIAEQFDCSLLQIPWNSFIAEREVDPELIARASGKWSGDASKLIDWYPTAVGKAPLRLARIICQRSNLRFDGELRKFYGNALIGVAISIVLLLMVIGFVEKLSLLDFILTSIVPAAPILVWAFREQFKQRDTAGLIGNIKKEAEAFWDAAIAGAHGEEVWLEKTRVFQDAILAHRRTSPLIFPYIYKVLREQLEAEMNVGADEMLAKIGIS